MLISNEFKYEKVVVTEEKGVNELESNKIEFFAVDRELKAIVNQKEFFIRQKDEKNKDMEICLENGFKITINTEYSEGRENGPNAGPYSFSFSFKIEKGEGVVLNRVKTECCYLSFEKIRGGYIVTYTVGDVGSGTCYFPKRDIFGLKLTKQGLLVGEEIVLEETIEHRECKPYWEYSEKNGVEIKDKFKKILLELKSKL